MSNDGLAVEGSFGRIQMTSHNKYVEYNSGRERRNFSLVHSDLINVSDVRPYSVKTITGVKMYLSSSTTLSLISDSPIGLSF